MKHILFSIIALLAASEFSLAQTYSVTLNDTVEVAGYMEDLQTLTIWQVNNTNDTLYFGWKKVSEIVPADWEASVCDNAICYTTLLDSSTTNPVAPSDSGFILLHVTAHVTFGTSVVRYAIWDIANPALRDTLTFITRVIQPSGIYGIADKNAISAYPNPVNDIIHITLANYDESDISLFNAVGEKMYEGKTNSYIEIQTSDFPSGTYFLHIKSRNDIRTQKIIIQ